MTKRAQSRSRAAVIVLVVAVGFAVGLTYPYFSLNQSDSRLEITDSQQYAILVVHIFTAAIALVLGPLQFVPKLRKRSRLHRGVGYTYLLLGVVPSALTAIPVAIWSGRLITQVGLTTAAALWLVTGSLALQAARRRDFAAHSAWMLRNYALTFLAVTSRILVPVFLISQLLFAGGDTDSARQLALEMIPVGQTVGWILNLIIVEIIIRRRPSIQMRDGPIRSRSE